MCYECALNIIYDGGVKGHTYLFGDSSTELPAYAGLHGKSGILHLDLVRASRMLSIHERVREGLSGVPM
jgi:hypothetical protein